MHLACICLSAHGQLTGQHGAVCRELQGAQAELLRLQEVEKRAEREREELLREAVRMESRLSALEREREQLEEEQEELR